MGFSFSDPDHDGENTKVDQDNSPKGQGSLWSSQQMAWQYVVTETRRRVGSFVVGSFTVFLVVMFITLLLNALGKAPIVFFKLAENSVGENDLVLTPGFRLDEDLLFESNVGGLPLINHTSVNISQQGVDVVTGSTPRWLLFTNVFNPETGTESSTALVLGIDSKQEDYIKLGREWPYGALNFGEVVLSDTIAGQIGVTEADIGNDIQLRLDLLSLANTLGAVSIADSGNVTSDEAREVISLFVSDVNSFYDTSVNVTIDLEALFGPVNLTSLNITALDQLADINITGFLNGVERVLEPVFEQLNVTLPDLDGVEIPGFGNVTFVIEEALNAFRQNLTNVTFAVELGPILDVVAPVILESISVSTTVTLRGLIGSPEGKWPSALGSVVVLETSTIVENFRDQLRAISDFNTNLTDVREALLDAGVDILALPGLNNETREDLRRFLDGESVVDPDGQLEGIVDGVAEEHYSLQSIIQYRDRVEAYLSSIQNMKIQLLRFTDSVAGPLGETFPATFTAPLMTALAESELVRVFLDNVFGAVVALVVILGIMLIYSLLLNDVDERTYEYGMLRALGMKQQTLIQLLMTKALTFAVPGIAFGMLAAFIFNVPVAQQIAGFAVLPADYSLSTAALLTAFFVGITMPLAANVVPISRALSKTLRDSLDVYHHVVSDVTVTVTKLSNLGLDLWQTALSLLLIVVGFITFYLIPYSFQFRRFDMFLAILNGILLGMLAGLCMLAEALQPTMEKVVLWFLLCGNNRRLKSIIHKNLGGHRPRNRKTAQMFTVCLAFVIFAGVMFTLQARSLGDTVQVFFGSDLVILAPTLDEQLNEQDMTEYLNTEVARTNNGESSAVVTGFTYVTFPLFQTDPVRRSQMSNLPGYPAVRNFVYGVQENYLRVTYNQYYKPTQTSSHIDYPQVDGKPDAVAVMWTQAGTATLPEETGGIRVPQAVAVGTLGGVEVATSASGVLTKNESMYMSGRSGQTPNELADVYDSAYKSYIDVIVSEALKDFASISLDTALELQVRRNFNGQDNTRDYLAKGRAMVSKFPGFFFSSYLPTAFFSSVICREDQYAKLLHEAYQWAGLTNYTLADSAPKQRLLIRVKDGTSSKQRDDVVNALRPFFKSDATVTLDTQSVVDGTKDAVDLLNLFFTVVGMIAMTMCFFILWLSFTANVRENAWEFGVLRSIGLSTTQVVSVYVFEALALVLGALILGTAIGILIAVSLTLQFNLFVEMPFKFVFPHMLFWTISSMAVLVAIAGSVFPAAGFVQKSVSEILRRS